MKRETTAGGGSADVRNGVTSVAGSVANLLAVIGRSKVRVLAVIGDDMQSVTQALLRAVASEGPMRLSALAAAVQSDPSTVSRQVATLVERGLLRRRADQFDGRASLLVLTDSGRELINERERERQLFYDEVMQGWTTAEITSFSDLLERFTASYDATHSRWIEERQRALSTSSTSSISANTTKADRAS